MTRTIFRMLLLICLVALAHRAVRPALANLLALDLLASRATEQGPVGPAAAEENVRQLVVDIVPLRRRVAAERLCEYGDETACTALYRQILDHGEGDSISRFRLANLLYEEGNETAAVELWHQAGAGRYWAHSGRAQSGCDCDHGEENGYCLLQRAARVAPGDGIIRYYLGRRDAICGKWDSAYQHLSVALGSDQLDPIEYYQALMNRGEAAVWTGRALTVGIADLTEAASLEPGDPWPWLRLCGLYRREQALTEALAACDQALALAPELGNAYYYRGRVWQEMGRLDEAVVDYQRALSLTPDLVVAEEWLEKATR